MTSTNQAVSDTKQHILAEAERLFATHGYDGVSMREIAEACHLTKANIYYYFEDKESLYVEVLEADMHALMLTLEQASEQGKTCREKITYITQAFMQLMNEKNTLILMTMRSFGGLEREIRGLVRRYRTEMLRPIRDVLDEGVQRGEIIAVDTNLASVMLVGMLAVFLAPRLLEIPFETTEHEIGPRAVQVFFDGIAKR